MFKNSALILTLVGLLAVGAMADGVTIIPDPTATEKVADFQYWPGQTRFTTPFDNWEELRATLAGGGRMACITYSSYDFSGRPATQATATFQVQDGAPFGFLPGNTLTVVAPTSAVDFAQWGTFFDPYTVSATGTYAGGGLLSVDITKIAQAWNADPSSYHGIEIWTTDAPYGGVISPANPWCTPISGTLTMTLANPGDANADTKVDDNDLNSLLSNWNTGTIWAQGNFKGTGNVDDNDLNALLSNWSGSGAAAPEPVTMSLLALGGASLLRRRNK